MAALLTVFAIVVLVQLVMAAYIEGVARAAADEGVRAGSRVAAGSVVCELQAQEVVESLLPGPLGSTASVACTNGGGDLLADVVITVDSPTPGVPTFQVAATGRATQEGSG